MSKNTDNIAEFVKSFEFGRYYVEEIYALFAERLQMPLYHEVYRKDDTSDDVVIMSIDGLFEHEPNIEILLYFVRANDGRLVITGAYCNEIELLDDYCVVYNDLEPIFDTMMDYIFESRDNGEDVSVYLQEYNKCVKTQDWEYVIECGLFHDTYGKLIGCTDKFAIITRTY